MTQEVSLVLELPQLQRQLYVVIQLSKRIDESFEGGILVVLPFHGERETTVKALAYEFKGLRYVELQLLLNKLASAECYCNVGVKVVWRHCAA